MGVTDLRARLLDVAADHPDPRCDLHPDDDVVSCGWKQAYAAFLNVLEGDE